MNVLFRCDAALHIGTGHVMRCLTLANALKAQGAITVFICREHAGHLANTIKAQGHECHLLAVPTQAILPQPDNSLIPPHAGWLGENWQTDLTQSRAAVADQHFDWLVVDHYALDEHWENAMRDIAKNIMVIDDLADRQHDCDILLDQTLGRTAADYQHRTPAHCTFLCGSHFALLRPEFLHWREYSIGQRKNAACKNILINMGGVDNSNITGKVLEKLAQCHLPASVAITVVMGMTAPHLASVQQQALKMPVSTEVKTNIDNMAEIMANSDLAIGAAGATSWERCCLGLPALMLVLADNQQTIAQALEQATAVKIIRNLADINILVTDLLHSTQSLNSMSTAALKLVDGKGIEKVLSAMEAINAQ